MKFRTGIRDRDVAVLQLMLCGGVT